MKRRTFMHASIATLATATISGAADDKKATADLYEHRVYHVNAGKHMLLDDYLSKALLPALKRYGIGPVGAFIDKTKADSSDVHVLIVHPNAESVARLSARLAGDDEFQKAAKDYLAIRATEPVYSRIESSLLAAIEGMPKLDKPDTAKPRLLNLRIYESHNERANKKKIEMFNKGELDIFRRVGLKPVFFAESIAGTLMPNLTYLLVFPDDDGRNAAWNKFRADPDWLKLKAMPEYADKEIVSRITNLLLAPLPYSEI